MKEILFIQELNEFLDLLPPSQFSSLKDKIMKQISQCLQSHHYHVAEHTIQLLIENVALLKLIVPYSVECIKIILKSKPNVNPDDWNGALILSFNHLETTLLEKFGLHFNQALQDLEAEQTNNEEKG
ncbi:MAG: Serine/threonine-protein phosphatase 2A 56 kDa regulatory subunit alpha isoform [Paramarteilia canceri]